MYVNSLKRKNAVIGVYFCISAAFFSGCAAVKNGNMEKISVKTVFHYGRGMGVSDMYVNEMWAGGHSGWGGGGSKFCCVEISSDRTKPVFVVVKWESCDIRGIEFKNGKKVDQDAVCVKKWHESNVPIHFSAEEPGNHFGLVIHVLPGHKIEAWAADKGILEEDYPGPPFPLGDAPLYPSVADE